MSLFGENAASARPMVQLAFAKAASGATDVRSERLRQDMGRLLHAGHLLPVLYWLQDRTPGQQATLRPIDFAGKRRVACARCCAYPPYRFRDRAANSLTAICPA